MLLLSRCLDDGELKSSALIVDALIPSAGATGLLLLAVAAATGDSLRPSSISLTLATRRRTSLQTRNRSLGLVFPLSYRPKILQTAKNNNQGSTAAAAHRPKIIRHNKRRTDGSVPSDRMGTRAGLNILDTHEREMTGRQVNAN